MCRVPVQLRELVKQRLAAAAEEIFELVERTITEYEEHLISKYEQQRQQEGVYTSVLPELTSQTLDLAAVQTLSVLPELTSQTLDLAAVQTLSVLPELTPETVNHAEGQSLSAEANVSDECPELERIQILNAQGSVKEEQLPVSIKEEPAPVVDTTDCDRVKEELPESQALSLLFIKQEQTEQTITQQCPDQEEHDPDHLQDQNPDPDPNPAQNEDHINQDFEEDNAEWEFEGLSPPRQSPDETENSSEEDEEAFSPNHPPKLLMFLNATGGSSGKTLNTREAQANVTDDETTENSSDPSDSEATSVKPQRRHVAIRLYGSVAQTKGLRLISNNTTKTINSATRAEDKTDPAHTAPARKQKRKRCGKKKSNTTKKEGGAESSHTCAVCKRTFDKLKKLTAHMKAHNESVPCPVCGKLFKQKGFLVKHMRVHQTKIQSQETAGKQGEKRKADQSDKCAMLEKRRKGEDGNATDSNQTEDSSDSY